MTSPTQELLPCPRCGNYEPTIDQLGGMEKMACGCGLGYVCPRTLDVVARWNALPRFTQVDMDEACEIIHGLLAENAPPLYHDTMLERTRELRRRSERGRAFLAKHRKGKS